jgi:hypothetical protein
MSVTINVNMKTSAKTYGLWAALLLAPALAASAAQTTTYQVDMSVQMALGNFNPGNGDTVFVSGNFSTPDWRYTLADGSTNYILTPDISNTNIYVGTFNDDILVGNFENHQFVINPGGNFTALQWESAVGNRFFQVASGATNLSAVYWNDVSNANLLVVSAVTFRVNLGVQRALGNFDPANDLAFVAGDWNWSATASQLTQSLADTNVWEGTFNLTNLVGTTVNFKFIMNTFAYGVVWEANGVGPGGANNRQFAFPSTATNLPVEFFNNITSATSIVVAPVTFEVNMIVEDALGNFSPGVDTVSVAGDALNNWDATVWQLSQTLTNTEVYKGTFNVTNLSGGTVNYKYTINSGNLWEDNNVGPGGGQNRQFAMPTSATNLPPDNFNNLANLGTLSISNSAPGQVTFYWMGGTRIALQQAAPLGAGWTDITNSLGTNSLTLSSSGAKFFRLKGP